MLDASQKRVSLIIAILVAMMLLPVFVSLIQPPVFTEVPASNQPYKDNYYQNDFTSARLVFARIEDFVVAHEKFFVVLFTALIAWFTGTLWRATTGLQELAAQQTVDMQRSLEIAGLSADAAKQAAEIAELTVQTMADTAQRQLRAYVWKEIEIASLNHTSAGVLSVESTIRNSGLTPAKRVRTWVRLKSLDTIRPQFEQPASDLPGTGFVVNPGSTQTLHASTPETMDEGDMSDIYVGIKTLFLWGEIRYDDVFGVERKTRFRLFLRHFERGAAIQQIWSYADDGNDAT